MGQDPSYSVGASSSAIDRATGNGSIVEVDPATRTERVLYNFAGGTDGQQPYSNLLDVGGVLYGAAQYGGTRGIGTIFTSTPPPARKPSCGILPMRRDSK